MSNPVGDNAARFIAEAGNRNYDPAVIDQAKRCLVDWMGVAIGAVEQPVSRAVRETALAWRAQGGARILRGGETAPALAAWSTGPWATRSTSTTRAATRRAI